MWKSKNYFRGLFVCLLLLVVLSPLTALPNWWPGAKKSVSQSPVANQEPNQSQNLLLTELQMELDGLKQIISNSQATIAKQAAELTALKASSNVSAINYDVLKGDYDKLLVAYEAVVNAPIVSEYESPWGAVIGASAIMDKAGAIGAEVSAGVSFKSYTLEFGLGYTPTVWKFAIPDPADFSYRAGMKFAF